MASENLKNISSFTGYQKFLTTIIALLQFTVILDFMVISPLGVNLVKSLNINLSQFGFLVSSYAFSAAISGILTAGYADRFDRKKMLVFFYSGFILGTFFCAVAGSYEALLAARILTGLFGGVIGSITSAVFADSFEIDKRGRAMSFLQMGQAASQVLGVPVSLYLTNKLGWHSTFWMIVIISIIIICFVLIKMKPVDTHLIVRQDQTALTHFWATISNSQYRVCYLATGVIAIGVFMLQPFSSNYIVDNLKISQENLPVIYFVTGISTIIVMPIIGKISDKYNKFYVFGVGSIISIVMIMIFCTLPVSPVWVVAIVNMLLFASLISRMIPAQSLNTMIPDQHSRGAFMSITSSLFQLSGGLGAILAGLIVTQTSKGNPLLNYWLLGLAVSGLSLVGIWLIYRIFLLTKTITAEAS